jgi:hypothetical protein
MPLHEGCCRTNGYLGYGLRGTSATDRQGKAVWGPLAAVEFTAPPGPFAHGYYIVSFPRANPFALLRWVIYQHR